MEHFSGGAQSQMLSNHNDNILFGASEYNGSHNNGWDFSDHFSNHFQAQYESPINNISYENRINVHNNHNNFVPDRMPSRPPFTPELQQALLQRQFDRSLQTPNKYVYSHGIADPQKQMNRIKNQKPKESQWMIFRAIDWLISTLIDPIFQIIFAILNFLLGWMF